MADVCDMAGDITERQLELDLRARRPVPVTTGECAWCEAPCEGVYCSAECRADHTQYQRRQQ